MNKAMTKKEHELTLENERLRQWINDLQSGMYINCVYCGHRYGPEDEVPASMADVLKKHIEECPEHPMSKMKAKLDHIEWAAIKLSEAVDDLLEKFADIEHFQQFAALKIAKDMILMGVNAEDLVRIKIGDVYEDEE